MLPGLPEILIPELFGHGKRGIPVPLLIAQFHHIETHNLFLLENMP